MNPNWQQFISVTSPSILRQFKHFLVLNNAYTSYKQEFYAPHAMQWRQTLGIKQAPIAEGLLTAAFFFSNAEHPNMWCQLRKKWEKLLSNKYNNRIDLTM